MTAIADRPTRVEVCAVSDLTPELGVAVLADGRQVALFLLADGRVFAVDNVCPYSGAAVMSRGITGSRGELPTIASPVHKQVFSLEDGRCLDTMGKAPLPGRGPDLATFAVTLDDGRVSLDLPAA
ncbi:nitrite reductase small subunit NirD [Oryzobacter sp. R7]|uniref:nitrite reductase small subunit NirD n=1 Tax=Oryzobacter faecalis TaxID=3388656 RepID=UPI00398CF08F